MPAVPSPALPNVDQTRRISALAALAIAGRSSTDATVMLASGGDSRIDCDPSTGRNRYGTRTVPCSAELSFASTTANNVTPDGYWAVERALDELLATAPSDRLSTEQWLDEIRGRISAHLGIAGSATVLAASGTDAEILALILVAGLTKRPLTNILIAPDETGSGVPLAAAGRHFLDRTALGTSVKAGTTIDAELCARTDVRSIAIRSGDGTPRSQWAIDCDAATAVEQELRRGRDVLLHILDTSKTGLTGLSRDLARQLIACAPHRVRVVVDACQLRCPFETIRQDLTDGFMVIVTGSKFAGGPPFSGALLLPPGVANEFAHRLPPSPGLADYSANYDWPTRLRAQVVAKLPTEANIGLGLRWVAALDALDRLSTIETPVRAAIISRFVAIVEAKTRDLDFVRPISVGGSQSTSPSSIVALTVLDRDGRPASFDEAQRIHRELRADRNGPVCHVGQAVRLGAQTVLRVAMSANDLAAVASRLTAQSFEGAFRPLEGDLDVVLSKWAGLARGVDAAR